MCLTGVHVQLLADDPSEPKSPGVPPGYHIEDHMLCSIFPEYQALSDPIC